MLSGLVLTCLGGPENKLSYKLSREGNSLFDRYFNKLAKNKKIKIRRFDTNGSDERQYCSSECNLPVGQLARTVYGKNKEYHTSADNKKFVKLKKFKKTSNDIFNFIKDNEKQIFLRRKQPYCEIQLGKRGLYPNTNSPNTWKDSSDNVLNSKDQLDIITNILAAADGLTVLSDVKFDKKYTYRNIKKVYDKLKKRGLLY